jgi:hypothetical protein
MLLVLETDNEPRVRDGYIRLSTRGHAMVRRGSTVRVRQRASRFCPLSRCFRCLDWRRLKLLTSTQRPPASTVDVGRRSARRGAGSPARDRHAPDARSGGRSWSGWRSCSGRDRRWRCRHGARRWQRCVGDRTSCAKARFQPRPARASTLGCGSCAGRGSRRAGPEIRVPSADLTAAVRSLVVRGFLCIRLVRPAGS